MRIRAHILFVLLVAAGICSNSPAQINEELGQGDVRTMAAALNDDIAEYWLISAELANTGKMQREVLVYRRDERGFQILADLDALINELQGKPEDTTREITAQLAELCDNIGETIFGRIEELGQRIARLGTELDSLSGGAVVAAQAHIQSLESIRIKYYEALVTHVDNRTLLGLSSDSLREKLDSSLHLFAETLAGQIEITGAVLEEVQSRAAQDPDNADVNAALMELKSRHEVSLVRLEAIIAVLDDLGQDSSNYKALMLQQSGSFSVSYFSIEAIASVFKDSWHALKGAFEQNATDIVFRLFLFILVLIIFRILARVTRRVVRAATERSSVEMSALLKNILVSTSGGAVMVLGILMALSQVGISLAPMLAGLGVAGFIVGFALQDSLGNFAAGAMILIYRPFDVNDFVEVTGASGLVKKMNLVSTTITTFDNQTLVIPNSKIWGDVIKNVTAQKERRVDLEFGIGYDDDIEKAERVLNEIVAAHEKILGEPRPNVKLHALADSSVNFIVRPWVKTEDYWDVYWDLMREVKLRFDREGISIPFPQRDVHLYRE